MTSETGTKAGWALLRRLHLNTIVYKPESVRRFAVERVETMVAMALPAIEAEAAAAARADADRLGTRALGLMVKDAAGEVIAEWFTKRLLMFSTRDDGSDDLILADRIQKAFLSRLLAAHDQSGGKP